MIVQVIHEENLSPPCTVIKERRVSHPCWHGGGLRTQLGVLNRVSGEWTARPTVACPMEEKPT